MRVRWLGHSCIEVEGRTNVLIDPDFVREPAPGFKYICITHGHDDHLGRVGELSIGVVLASKDVCEMAMRQGVPSRRLVAVEPGYEIGTVRVLPGYSAVGRFSELCARLFGRRRRLPGGTPLSFLVEDDLSLLHIGDAYRYPVPPMADILCLPWRRVPFANALFQQRLIGLAHSIAPRYVIPIHHDIPPWRADPELLRGRVSGEVVVPLDWMEFK
jgi:L-ascorbate metabolism protein UlaG (beta-lactamase superfamily)